MGKKRKLPILATAGVVIKMYDTYANTHWSDPKAVAQDLKYNLLGIDTAGKFSFSLFLTKWAPVLVGVGGSLAAQKLGVNKPIASIPYVKM